MANKKESVYKFDENIEKFILALEDTPNFEYFDNGLIKLFSYDNGKLGGEKYLPYHFAIYNKKYILQGHSTHT